MDSDTVASSPLPNNGIHPPLGAVTLEQNPLPASIQEVYHDFSQQLSTDVVRRTERLLSDRENLGFGSYILIPRGDQAYRLVLTGWHGAPVAASLIPDLDEALRFTRKKCYVGQNLRKHTARRPAP